MTKSSHDLTASSVPALIIFGGLPGTGKTTIARLLAREFAAVYLRIDSIEQAVRDCVGGGRLAGGLEEAGYRVGYALAEDNLRLGRTVVADCVNPVAVTRDAWLAVARRAQAAAVEIEITCSDAAEHRRRAEARHTDIAGLKLPTWDDIASRDYHAWNRPHFVVDTAGQSAGQCVRRIRNLLPWPLGR